MSTKYIYSLLLVLSTITLPAYAQGLSEKIEHMYYQGQFAAVEKLISASPAGPEKELAAGNYALFKGDFAQAIAHFKKAGNSAHALAGLADAYVLTKRYKLADQAAGEAMRLAKTTSEQSHANLAAGIAMGGSLRTANLFEKLRRGPQVKQYFEKAYDLDRNDPMTQYVLGRFYLLAPAPLGGNPKKAVELFAKAAEGAPFAYRIQGWYIKGLKATQNPAYDSKLNAYKKRFGNNPKAIALLDEES
jgi:tetratricopeptide (TPR) repeat protein